MKPYKHIIIFILLILTQITLGCTENQTPIQNDNDGDGYNNTIDIFPDNPLEWQDTDNDTYGDNTDAFPNNPNEWNDTDHDGIGDNTDYYPNDQTRWQPPYLYTITENNTNTIIDNSTITTINITANNCNITISKNTSLTHLIIHGNNNTILLSKNHTYTLTDTGDNNTINLYDQTDSILQQANPYLQNIYTNNTTIKNYAESLTNTCNSKECIITTIYRHILETYTITETLSTTDNLQTPQETIQNKQGTCNDITILLISLLENLDITTHLVLTNNAIYPYIPDIDTANLWNHIQTAINTYIENQWEEPLIQTYQNTLNIPSLQLWYYGGEQNSSFANYIDTVTITYHLDTNYALHLYVIPNQNELYNIAQGQQYTDYPEYEKTALISIINTIELDSYGGFVFVNEGLNDTTLTVDFTFTFNPVFYTQYTHDDIEFFTYDNKQGIILDPCLDEYGFPGLNLDIQIQKTIINLHTKNYTIYD